ncbi:MAG: hypothetical protein U1E70_16005 [Acetobacteraceae bacterium]
MNRAQILVVRRYDETRHRTYQQAGPDQLYGTSRVALVSRTHVQQGRRTKTCNCRVQAFDFGFVQVSQSVTENENPAALRQVGNQFVAQPLLACAQAPCSGLLVGIGKLER